jgi:predicted nucleic acid-binding protein
MIIADSDVLIDSLRGQKEIQGRIDLELQTGDLATTVISVFELLSGAKTESQKRKVNSLLSALRIVPLDAKAVEIAASVRHDLESEGMGLAMADYLIAGICLRRNAILLTRNRSHFERIPGLTLGMLTLGEGF